LVIDLPNARLEGKADRLAWRTPEIEGVRLSQFQENPPIARIVVDLTKPVAYSWEATGNLLLIRLGTDDAASRPPSATAIAAKAQPVAAPIGSPAYRRASLGTSRLPAGSAVTAGSDAAIVSLGRGGEVRVCPGTTVSVTPSQNNRSLMLGMSTGSLEAHYTLDASADSIITPDFRILLPGPGDFHYAINADSRGNTCIQALPGNTASVIVSELLGDGTYQVKPTEQVVFHSGQLRNLTAVTAPAGCGCPAPESSLVLASSEPLASTAKQSAPANLGAANSSTASPSFARGSETAALPPSNPNDVHVQVDAPFVFRGDDPTAAPVAVVKLEILPLRSTPPPEPFQSAVLAPPRNKPERHGFFGKLRGFFAAVFG
jgi:hypothetical protein